jgi:lipopolysaccharide export system permease protein
MAVLVAVLMAFGQLTADHEITALKAAGVNLGRVLAPVLALAAVLCGGMILFNNFVLPDSNHRLSNLTGDMLRKRPTVSIESGRFVDDLPGYRLLIGDKDERTDAIRDVQVYVLDKQGRPPDVLVAPRGRLHFENRGHSLHIDLYEGELHSLPDSEADDGTGYRVTRFHEHTVIIPDVGSDLERTDRKTRGEREMSVAMMEAEIAEKRIQIARLRDRVGGEAAATVRRKLDLLDPDKRAQAFAQARPLPPGALSTGTEQRLRDTAHLEGTSIDAYLRQIRAYKVEIHKKYSIPVACLVFVLIGAPLAVRSGRSGMTMAAGFSLACFFVYWLALTLGEKLADRDLLSPFLAMWLVNLFFGALGLWLLWGASRESTVIDWTRIDPRRLRALRRRPA